MFGFIKKIFKRKKDMPLDGASNPDFGSSTTPETLPSDFNEPKPSFQTEPQSFQEPSDKQELVLSKLNTIDAKLDNLDQRLRNIEKLAEE